MPFEPRLIQPDSDESPAEARRLAHDPLPDELAELAAQLAADADHLATSYPAAAADRRRPAEPARGAGYRWPALAAGGCAAALLLSALAVWNGLLPGATAQKPVASHAGQSAARLPDRALPVDRPPPIAPMPVSFQQLSAPEKEAVLDLLEEVPLVSAHVSI